MKNYKKISKLFIAVMLLLGSVAHAQNMNNIITLKVRKDSSIYFKEITAVADSTPIRIICGNIDSIIYVNKTESSISIDANDTIMTIYGDLETIKSPIHQGWVSEYPNYSHIIEVNASNHTTLTFLDCESQVNLTSINVSNCSKLETLLCSNCNLTSLNVKNATNLKHIHCFILWNYIHTNLKTLDVQNCSKLETLRCHTNPKLTSIKNISDCVHLHRLDCSKTNISAQTFNEIMCSLPDRNGVSEGIFEPAEEEEHSAFMASNSTIATSKNWKVRYGDWHHREIVTNGDYTCNGGGTMPQVNMNNYVILNVTKDSLIKINLSTDTNNTLVKIISGDFIYNIVAGTTLTGKKEYYAATDTMIVYGDVHELDIPDMGAKIIAIDASNNVKLCTLWCNRSNLNSLNVNGCTALKKLSCHTNPLLTDLNVSNCTALEDLKCFKNQLSSLNINGCTSLQKLDCSYNKLTTLDISTCNALNWLACDNNSYTTYGYDSLMCLLPTRKIADNAYFRPLRDANAVSIEALTFMASNSNNAKIKNWNVVYYQGDTIPNTHGKYDCINGYPEEPEEPEDTTNITEIKLSNIELYPNPANSVLNIKNATDNVQIFDITGRIIKNIQNNDQEILQIDVSNLAKGMYFVKVGNYTTKFVKE